MTQEAEKILFRFISEEVERSERGEITPNTIRNPIKAFKLLLEMNDVISISCALNVHKQVLLAIYSILVHSL